MNFIESITFFLYDGIRPAPFIVIFLFIYPKLWENRAKLTRSFNFLSLFALYMLFVIPGWTYCQLHQNGLLHRYSQTYDSDQVLDEYQMMELIKNDVNDLNLFEYDECLINYINIVHTKDYIEYTCEGNDGNKYKIDIIQDVKRTKVKLKVRVVGKEGGKFPEYPVYGIKVKYFKDIFGEGTPYHEFVTTLSNRKHKFLVDRDVDYYQTESPQFKYLEKQIEGESYFIRYGSTNKLYYIYLEE